MEWRQAMDGQPYTHDEFLAWYYPNGQEYWANAEETRRHPDGNWYTQTEADAEQSRRRKQAAEQRRAAGAPAVAAAEHGGSAPAEPAGTAPHLPREQTPTSLSAEQRQAAEAPAEAWQPVQEQMPASPPQQQRQEAGAPAEAPQPEAPAEVAQPAQEQVPASPPALQLDPWLAAENIWRSSKLRTVLLPENMRVAADMPLCKTLHDLLQAAYMSRPRLPLPADYFFVGNIYEALGCPDALQVTLESINGICDSSRIGRLRIDILVYHRCGAVTRYHPGLTEATNAEPHKIPHGSCTYNRTIALHRGVGAALHMHAPGIGDERVAAAQHNVLPLLVTLADLADVSAVDSKLVNQASLRAALNALPPGETDWSRQGFRWWVFMAGRADSRATIDEGIIRVTGVNPNNRCAYMRVTTRERMREWKIDGGRLYMTELLDAGYA